MKEYEEFFANLGITDPKLQAEIVGQTYGYAFELTISKLAGELSLEQKTIVERILESGDLDDPGMPEIFNTEACIAVFQESLTAAFDLVAHSAVPATD